MIEQVYKAPETIQKILDNPQLESTQANSQIDQQSGFSVTQMMPYGESIEHTNNSTMIGANMSHISPRNHSFDSKQKVENILSVINEKVSSQ